MHTQDSHCRLSASGSTDSPKGVVRVRAAPSVFAAMGVDTCFDYHDGDVYWCTADVGWVTGHSYILYGPLANSTTLMFEGVPNYPDDSRFWSVIDKHKVNIFYTTPTAIRALDAVRRRAGEEDLAQVAFDCSAASRPDQSRTWGSSHPRDRRGGLPDRRTTSVDDATGGILITPLPGAAKLKPGSATNASSASCTKSSTPTAKCWRADPRAICVSQNPGRARCRVAARPADYR